MKTSTQTLIQELTAVDSRKNELEFGDMSELKSHFLLLAHQDSNSDEETVIRDT